MSADIKKNQRKVLLQLWNDGVRDAKKIHALTKFPPSTIYDNLKRLKKSGSTKPAGGNGQPRKIDGASARALGQYIRRDTSLSTRNLAAKMLAKGIELSHQTIGRHLKKIGYSKSLPRATSMLTEKHKQNRVSWAQNHLNDTWERTFFSDETAFELYRNTVRRWHKGARPVRYMPKSRVKIFAWGGFCIKGKVDLFLFSQIMDAEFYVGILRERVPEIRRIFGTRWRFQQDNDPKHTSRLAKSFLAENMPELIDWPSNSPDLNPIENLWGIVKGNVEKRMPKNLDELKRYMSEEWAKIPKFVLIGLAQSMRRRCELVIESKGERIAY